MADTTPDELAEWRVRFNPQGYGRLGLLHGRRGSDARRLGCLECGIAITHPTHKPRCHIGEHEERLSDGTNEVAKSEPLWPRRILEVKDQHLTRTETNDWRFERDYHGGFRLRVELEHRTLETVVPPPPTLFGVPFETPEQTEQRYRSKAMEILGRMMFDAERRAEREPR